MWSYLELGPAGIWSYVWHVVAVTCGYLRLPAVAENLSGLIELEIGLDGTGSGWESNMVRYG